MARSDRRSVPALSGREVELRVERLLHGPGALARAEDGRVVLLDGGLPGERVRVRIDGGSRRALRGRVVRLLEPAPARRRPPCEVIGLCGGCPWQPLGYAQQLEAKQEIVLRELGRACGAAPEEVAPTIHGAEWRTRHRIRLAVERRRGGPAVVGYRGRGTHAVVGVEECAIAAGELVAALPAARRLAELATSVGEIEISVDDFGAVYFRGLCRAKNPPDIERLWTALRDFDGGDATRSRVAGLVLESAARSNVWRQEAGAVIQRMEVAPDLVLGVPVGAFTQVNRELNRALVAAVVAEAGADGPHGRFVLDLFCGAGNFSLPLARAGATVLGIDADRRAVASAAVSASSLGLAGSTRFRAARLDGGALADLPRAPDVVVIDPPRTGAAAVLPAVLARRPSRIVYVSCDVATLGRDARTILEAGWRFSSVRLVDLTPQTYRAEVLGVFRLTWERGGPYRAS